MTTSATRPTPPIRRALVFLLAVGAVRGGFLFGFDTSTMNSAINGIRPDLGLGPAQIGWVQSISLLGAVVGAGSAGVIALRRGRTAVIALAGASITLGELAVVGSGAVAPAAAVAAIMAGRALVGLGIGAASSVVPAYLVEMGPTALRGVLGMMWEFSITIGQVVGLLSGFAITALAGGESLPGPFGIPAWRWMFVVVALLGALYLLAGLVLPDSPADLVRRGRTEEAADLVARLGGDAPAEKVAAIAESIERSAGAPGLRALLGPVLGLKRVVWIGIGLAVFQQLLGVNAIKNYSNAVWQSVGFDSGDSFAMSLIAAVVGMAATFVAVLLVRRVPARTLLLIGTAVMVPAHLVMAWAFGQTDPSGALGPGVGLAALIAMMAYSVGFSLSWGPAMWLLLTTIFDHGIRTVATAFCSTVNWLATWLVTLTFPLLAAFGAGVPFGFYAAFGLAAAAFLIVVLPRRPEDLARG